jgi:hypothetical protein
MATDKLTITLTDRNPVTIDKATWGVIASARDYDGQHESQANRTWRLTVRQHDDDGRTLVYGVHSTAFQNEYDRRAGQLVTVAEAIPGAIRSVCAAIGADPRLADACIADLPAEEI